MADNGQAMQQTSRQTFLKTAGVGLAVAPLATAAPASAASEARAKIGALLAALPGTKAASMFASDGSFEYALHPAARLVIASTFKVFVAVTALALVEEGKISLADMLPLDASVWVPSSAAFTPELHGKVPLGVAIQEMIAYSDNTATDMVMKHVGPDRIRAFIASAGLTSVQIPNSTRAVFSYLAGYPKGVDASYEVLFGLKEPPKGLQPHKPDNDVVTMKGAMGQIAAFYQRAMAGEFFKKAETLTDFQAAMNNGKLVEVSAPLGSQVFTKGGSYNSDAENGVVVAGAMQTLDKYVYYAIGVNWTDPAKGAFERGEAAFLKAVKEMLTLARGVQFPGG